MTFIFYAFSRFLHQSRNSRERNTCTVVIFQYRLTRLSNNMHIKQSQKCDFVQWDQKYDKTIRSNRKLRTSFSPNQILSHNDFKLFIKIIEYLQWYIYLFPYVILSLRFVSLYLKKRRRFIDSFVVSISSCK